MKRLILDFGSFSCAATLRDSVIAGRLYEGLPVTVALTAWGREVYGPLGLDLGREAPVAAVPPGAIAYTDRGGYLCIFFGQDPAWPVEFIGMIDGDAWRRLLTDPTPTVVTLRRADGGGSV